MAEIQSMANNTALSKYGVLLATSAIAGGIVYWQSHSSSQPPTSVRVSVPSLSTEAQQGQTLFEANCTACHGVNAAGTSSGPPLIHKSYEPSHHADITFTLAVKRGVRAHHWRFGNMPPVPGIDAAQITKITHYVRELQRANGIR